jgi:S-adenosylmethionine:tRNA ribosyltransferase-isomerase
VVREDGSRENRIVRDLPELLSPSDALVVNDTKVIAARLKGSRPARGENGARAKIEVLLLKQTASDSFTALARPAKRLEPGDRITFGGLEANLIACRERGEVELQFDRSGEELRRAIAAEGEMPLPPYIAGKRPADARDTADYQTHFARAEGSVAAPTAGLHFTEELLSRLAERGICRHAITLHVGAGTFLPVTVDDTKNHRMHPETAVLDADTAAALNAARSRGGRIVAVGSTALRTLESAVDDKGVLQPFAGETSLFITPGYRFKSVDVMLTNFHLPRSTLFMLVCAFAGTQTMKAAYRDAIANRYRFYSYGDACLLFGKKT